MNLPFILGIVFIVLKLVHVITWSWWLVLLPLYAPLVLFGVLCMSAFVMGYMGIRVQQ